MEDDNFEEYNDRGSKTQNYSKSHEFQIDDDFENDLDLGRSNSIPNGYLNYGDYRDNDVNLLDITADAKWKEEVYDDCYDKEIQSSQEEGEQNQNSLKELTNIFEKNEISIFNYQALKSDPSQRKYFFEDIQIKISQEINKKSENFFRLITYEIDVKKDDQLISKAFRR